MKTYSVTLAYPFNTSKYVSLLKYFRLILFKHYCNFLLIINLNIWLTLQFQGLEDIEYHAIWVFYMLCLFLAKDHIPYYYTIIFLGCLFTPTTKISISTLHKYMFVYIYRYVCACVFIACIRKLCLSCEMIWMLTRYNEIIYISIINNNNLECGRIGNKIKFLFD